MAVKVTLRNYKFNQKPRLRRPFGREDLIFSFLKFIKLEYKLKIVEQMYKIVYIFVLMNSKPCLVYSRKSK